ncbi:MAG: ATP-dependent zinc metalloprotease FtsH [Pseudomonadales bacterium]
MGKNLLLWLIIAAVLMVVFQSFNPEPKQTRMSYTEFMKNVHMGNIRKAEIRGEEITAQDGSGNQYVVIWSQNDQKLQDDLLNNNVEVNFIPAEKQSVWSQLLIASFPILIIIAVFMLFMRQMQGGGSGRGGPMAFGRSKAKLLSEDQIKTTFADVAGVDEAKEEVQELVEFLRDPGKFQRLGGHIPRGILMVGQPGTGKTLLAKAIAGEAKVPFFSISGSDFVEMFVGVGASRVRDMFEQAKKQSPCIIFIDEIDAVGRHRGAGLGGGHDEREQTLNQLLVEMDGFEPNDGIIVIAATNRPDVLDPALLRPGRFDRQVVVGLPDIRGREQILKVHMRKVPLADDVDPSIIARGTPMFSGADLENLVNEAALFAARANKRLVEMEEFEKAKDKIMMGTERKSMVMSEKEKRNTAYHEAGHTIVGRLMPEHDPVYKVSIIPRGRALGVTMFLPEEDRHSISRQGLRSQICSLFGGRIAEEMILGKEGVTTGASNDIERATSLARNMVTKWGLSDKLGPLMYDEDDGEPFLGMSAGARAKPRSDETSKAIDQEVRAIIDECYKTAEQILSENVDKLHAMADALMEYETLSSDQLDDIMAGAKPRAPKTPTPPSGDNKPSGEAPIGGPAEET